MNGEPRQRDRAVKHEGVMKGTDSRYVDARLLAFILTRRGKHPLHLVAYQMVEGFVTHTPLAAF